MNAPSLDEILHTYRLDRRHLELKCSRDIQLRISEKVLDWKMIGRLLNFRPEQLEAIDSDYRTEDQRKTALFDAWSNRDGSEATCLKLSEILLRRQRRDLVELLCELVKIPTATPICETPSTASVQPGQLLTLDTLVCNFLQRQLSKYQAHVLQRQ